MTQIYLCDDESVWLERLEKSIMEYAFQTDLDLRIIFRSTSPTEFLNYLDTNLPSKGSIYFLDIDFKTSLTGLDLAAYIRDQDAMAQIILVTTHEEMMVETFHRKLAVLDYIIKDNSPLDQQINDTLQKIEERYNKKGAYSPLLLQIDKSYIPILPEDIYFIETIKEASHKVCIHMGTELIRIPGSLNHYKDRLGKEFYACHKCCLVNLNHIQKFNSNTGEILLDNGEICYCSVRGSKKMVKVLQAQHKNP